MKNESEEVRIKQRREREIEVGRCNENKTKEQGRSSETNRLMHARRKEGRNIV